MREQILITLDADLADTDTLVLPAKVNPFRFADADHVAVVGSTRYASPTDFTVACDGNGTLTVTWGAATIPADSDIRFGIALTDIIIGGAAAGTGGGGGGAITAADGAIVSIGAKNDAAAASDGANASIIAFLKRIAEQNTSTNAALTDTAPVGVFDDGNSYVVVGTSQTDSAVGDANDTIAGVILFPADAAPAGSVVLKDGSTTLATIPAGTLTEATPRFVPLFNIRMTTGFKVTTPSDVTAIVAYRART